MALITITPTNLVEGTETIDLVAGGTSVVSGNTFEVAIGDPRLFLFIIEEVGGGAAVIVFDAGDYPPSDRQGLGTKTVTMAASDLKIIALEGARYMQNDGKITGTVSVANVRILVLKLPLSY
jgi:hypothetical protein